MNNLTKSATNRSLFGVCGGLSKYTGINVSIIRILFIFGAIFTGSIVLWIYLLMALILPNEEKN
jgi:phage shock protein PspC (stress-responsive transcriptional regulator)